MPHALGVRVFSARQSVLDLRIEETARKASGHHAERDDYNPKTSRKTS
jgi:hypothetical protein